MMNEVEHAQSGVARISAHNRFVIAFATAALVALAVGLPLAYQGVMAAPYHKGFIACTVGRTTCVPITFYDYGKWPWFDTSGRIEAVWLDDADLTVASFRVELVGQGLNRQHLLLKLEVVPLTPGTHSLAALNLRQRGRTTAIPVGSIMFDARTGPEGSLPLAEMSEWFTWAWRPPQGSDKSGFGLISQLKEPVKVRVVNDGLPEGVTLAALPEGVTVAAPETEFGPQEQVLMTFILTLTNPPGRAPARHVVLVRPWLEVTRSSGPTLLQPGPMLAMEGTGGF